MRPRVLIGAVVAALAVFMIFGFGMQFGARSIYGPGWGPGMMGGYAMGPGMMRGYGYAMGPWAMGPWTMGPNARGFYDYGTAPWVVAPNRTDRAAVLSADEVRTYFERSLAWQANPRVKLGPVMEKDADTITADIVTTDKEGLVQRFAVNRQNGFIQSSED